MSDIPDWNIAFARSTSEIPSASCIGKRRPEKIYFTQMHSERMFMNFRMLKEQVLDLVYPDALYCICCGKVIDSTRPIACATNATGDSLGDGEDLPEMRKNLIREQSGRHLFQLPGTCSYLRYGVHLLRVRAASPVHCFCAEISWADGYRPHRRYGDARPDGGPSPGNRTDVRFDFARACIRRRNGFGDITRRA